MPQGILTRHDATPAPCTGHGRKPVSIYIADSSPLRRDAVGKRVVMEGDVFAQLKPAALAL